MSKFVQMLVTAAAADPQRGITTGEPAAPVRRTWTQVHAQARRAAGSLADGGLRRGDAVALLAGDPSLIAPAVQGVWLAGGSVTMLHQPTSRTDLEAWAADTVTVLRMIGSSLVLLGPPFDALAAVLDEHGIGYRMLADLVDEAVAELPEPVAAGEDDTALLQLTSGSTAEPKAVRITHRNLHANMTAMVQAAALDPDTDVLVSWLPLFHDMGMVGFLILPMALGIELVKVTPVDFLSTPLLWPELISRHRGTVTAAPNFAYGLLGRRLPAARDSDVRDVRLDTLRFALDGAEPIEPAAVRAFTDAGVRFGLDPRCMVCAYGMAEATLAVSFAPSNTGMQVDTIDAQQFESRRRAVPTGRSDGGATRAFPLLGPPLPGIEVRIIDDAGRVLGEREVGRIRLRGEAVTAEYLTVDGPESTQDAQGWLDSGDDGYLVDGAVVVCGRRKDVIIMGGRNVYPTDIERAASNVDGVRAGNVVAVRIDAGRRRESFAVAVESRLAGDADAERTIRRDVTSRVVDAIGMRPGAVVVLAPSSLPKTPSGKLRRAATWDRIAPLLRP
ncbi:MAG: AMP-binding protein [Pseudonocardiaceae bacterium]|nr:AMP-binding protein [Pseudonocardiaceae bacterium]